ncbi:pectinesterase 31-like [Hibiscus syriacus]|nr:pectinesterase 31-like [Hibiscus syriacus]
MRDCYIEGNVDYIFGNSTALFEHCHLHCKPPGFVTAHKRGTTEETTAYVFLRCVLTGNGETGCFGPGSHRNERVAWSKELNDQEAEEFLVHKFIDTDPEKSWLCQKMGHRVPVNA